MDALIYLVSTVLIVYPSLYYQKKKKESKILADSAKLQKVVQFQLNLDQS